MNFPIGTKLLIQAIEEAAASPKGRAYRNEMVTLTYEDGKLSIQPFKLADMGDEDAQYRFLYSVLLEECRPKEFTEWAHLAKRGKNRYPKGTGYGWHYMRSPLERHGLSEDESEAMLTRMIEEGLVIELGMFKNGCGSDFMMYGAVLKDEVAA